MLYKPGDRVYRWVLVGKDGYFERQDIQPLTVIRINDKTITVKTDQGSVIRIFPQDIRGIYEE